MWELNEEDKDKRWIQQFINQKKEIQINFHKSIDLLISSKVNNNNNYYYNYNNNNYIKVNPK